MNNRILIIKGASSDEMGSLGENVAEEFSKSDIVILIPKNSNPYQIKYKNGENFNEIKYIDANELI